MGDLRLLVRYGIRGLALVALNLVGASCLRANEAVVLLGEEEGGSDGDTAPTVIPSGDPTDEVEQTDEDTQGETDEPATPPLYDVGTDGESELGQPAIPTTCAESHHFPSSYGCEFYAVDLDQQGLLEYGAFGVSVANPHLDQVASVTVSRFANSQWSAVSGPLTLSPGGSEQIGLLDLEKLGTGLFDSASYRIDSDVPITATQFSPIDGDASESTSAALLHPTSSWTSDQLILGWRTHANVGERAFISILGAVDSTAVTIVPSAPINAGGGIPMVVEGGEIVRVIDVGQMLQLAAMSTLEEVEEGIAGTTVVSGGEHPTAVFSAHTCAAVPDFDGKCGHVQEQITAQLAGHRFVAARLPIRDAAAPEATEWQLLATTANTTVEFTSAAPIDGLPAQIVLEPGEPFVPAIGGPLGEGDFEILADAPIVVAAYMTNPTAEGWGAPAMLQLAPTDRFIQDHYLYFPPNFARQAIVVTRAPGTTVWIGDQALADGEFELVVDYEVARVFVGPGSHHVRGDLPILAAAVGWRLGDGYAYLGGWGIPIPPYPAPE